MENEKLGFIKWVKTHKKELIIAGVSVATIVAIVIGYKNREELLGLWKTFEGKMKKVPQSDNVTKAFKDKNEISTTEMIVTTIPEHDIFEWHEVLREVCSHIRNLPQGWKASPEKIATAVENGYILQPGQTWVDGYIKHKMVA